MRRTRVYVAGPYTADPAKCTTDAMRVGDVLLEAGYAPFVPHLSHFWETTHKVHGYEDWMALDMAYLAVCDVVIRIDGTSSGADREVAWAIEHGVQVLRVISADVIDGLVRALESLGFAAMINEDAPGRPNLPEPIRAAIHRMTKIFSSKNDDYSDGSSWSSNFEDVGRQLGLPRELAAEMLIAVKQARLRSLATRGSLPKNEAVEDTVLDRAVYALIALAMSMEGATDGND